MTILDTHWVTEPLKPLLHMGVINGLNADESATLFHHQHQLDRMAARR
jgi:hypothetical protein